MYPHAMHRIAEFFCIIFFAGPVVEPDIIAPTVVAAVESAPPAIDIKGAHDFIIEVE